MSFNEIYYSDNFSTFDEWLEIILYTNEDVYPRFRIPYDEWLKEYIDDIQNKSIEEVKALLRHLLSPITREADIDAYETFLLRKESDDEVNKEMARKLSHNEIYSRLANGQDAWEGLTWVLELLPSRPYKAIQALESYQLAQPGLPDDRVIGLEQCAEIIMAKFINFENPLEKLTNLKPVEFEWLIEQLYENMGYTTEWTPSTRDGGKDIIASITRADGNESVYVECKLYNTTKLKRETVMAFLYVLTESKANRGVIFCTGYVNENIKKIDKRIQIWSYEEINVLLNAHLGTNWVDKLDKIIGNKRRKYQK